MTPINIGEVLCAGIDLFGSEMETAETAPETPLAFHERFERLVRLRRLQQRHVIRQAFQYRVQHFPWQVQKRYAVFVRVGRLKVDRFNQDCDAW